MLSASFGDRCGDVAETVRKLVGSNKYLFYDMFDAVPISIFFVSTIEVVTVTCGSHRGRAVNERRGVVDVVFLTKFGDERVSEDLLRGRFEVCMERFV